MKITYLDADTREVIKVADYLTPELTSTSAKQRAEKFANILSAEIVKIFPLPDESEWTVELKIPLGIRRMYTPLPGDRVLFLARAGVHFHEMIGVYQFTRCQSYVILDDRGGEWEVQNMWQMKKV